ncbi:hypothetical protein MOMA_04360 [Moraxella macacae 0408225]|uniref:Uncharacterized protein n=1 Tax=Moraxella macacae 0408225 TaxID=1230338 RepID=L2FAZ5_9GAMM|nr:hypothetical protein MOMA_04360 [Moraxella macacae 0408225]
MVKFIFLLFLLLLLLLLVLFLKAKLIVVCLFIDFPFPKGERVVVLFSLKFFDFSLVGCRGTVVYVAYELFCQ